MSNIKITLGDITKLSVDCIVNAANGTLLGGGGVDGEIHSAAGPQLKKACYKLGGCKVGQAKITKGYNLPAKFIIHTVGPYYTGHENDPIDLASCYSNSLRLAMANNLHSIAFPSISTGVYQYPKEKAAKIALETVNNFLSSNDYEFKITFVCYSSASFEIYKRIAKELGILC